MHGQRRRHYRHVCLIFAGMSGALVSTGCAERWQFGFATDARVDLPPFSYESDRSRLAGSDPEWLDIQPGGSKTILIAVWSETEPDMINEIATRTYVVVLDGPPMKGHYEVTPANGRFLPGTNWYPPRAPYEGLEGTLEIESVTGSKIDAYCGLRNVLTRPAAPLYPLRGHFTFARVPAGKSRMGSVQFRADAMPE